MISRTKVLRYRPEKGDLLVEAGVGWKPGVVGNATLAVDYRSPAARAFQTGAPVTIKCAAGKKFITAINFCSVKRAGVPRIVPCH